jgi:tetratricopeptide (TPR) repeat protein
MRALLLCLPALVWAQADQTGLEPAGPLNADLKTGHDLVRRGRFVEAIPPLRRAQAANDSPAVLKLLAVSYYGLRQHRLFLAAMEAAQRKQPADWAPYYYLGRYYDSDQQDFAQAELYFRKALERNPDHFRAISYLGYCLESTGRKPEAAGQYRRAIALVERARARFSHPYQRLALVLLAQDPTSALPFARKAVEQAPEEAASHKALAQVEAALGHGSAAIRAWESAAALDPTDSSVPYRLYRAHLAAGDRAKADAALAAYQRIAALYGATN